MSRQQVNSGRTLDAVVCGTFQGQVITVRRFHLRLKERNLSLRIWGESAGGWGWGGRRVGRRVGGKGPAASAATASRGTKKWKVSECNLIEIDCHHPRHGKKRKCGAGCAGFRTDVESG